MTNRPIVSVSTESPTRPLRIPEQSQSLLSQSSTGYQRPDWISPNQSYQQGRSISGRPSWQQNVNYQMCLNIFVTAGTICPITISTNEGTFTAQCDAFIYQYRAGDGSIFAAIWCIMCLRSQTICQFRRNISEGVAIFHHCAEQIRTGIIPIDLPKHIPVNAFDYYVGTLLDDINRILVDMIHSIAVHECLIAVTTIPVLFRRDLVNGTGPGSCGVILRTKDGDEIQMFRVRTLISHTIKDAAAGSDIWQKRITESQTWRQRIDDYIRDEMVERAILNSRSITVVIPFTHLLFKYMSSDTPIPDSIKPPEQVLDREFVSFILVIMCERYPEWKYRFDEGKSTFTLSNKSCSILITRSMHLFWDICSVIPAHLGNFREDANYVFATIELWIRMLTAIGDEKLAVRLSEYARLYEVIRRCMAHVVCVEQIAQKMVSQYAKCERHFVLLNDHVAQFVLTIDNKTINYTLNRMTTRERISQIAGALGITIANPDVFLREFNATFDEYIHSQKQIPVVIRDATYMPRTPLINWPA